MTYHLIATFKEFSMANESQHFRIDLGCPLFCLGIGDMKLALNFDLFISYTQFFALSLVVQPEERHLKKQTRRLSTPDNILIWVGCLVCVNSQTAIRFRFNMIKFIQSFIVRKTTDKVGFARSKVSGFDRGDNGS
jgi:hypothetical protein